MSSASNDDGNTGAMVTESPVQPGALVPADHYGGALTEYGWPMGPPAKPEILSASINTKGIWNAFRRRWPLAVGVALLCAGAGVLLTALLMPVRYRAITAIRVSMDDDGVLPNKYRSNPHTLQSWGVYIQTQTELIESPFVLRAVLRREEIAQLPMIRENAEDGEEAVDWMMDYLDANVASNSEIIQISFNGTEPEQTKKLLDAIRDAYMREIVEEERRRKLERYKLLQDQVNEKSEAVRKLSSAVMALQEQLGIKPGTMPRDGNNQSEGISAEIRVKFLELEGLGRELAQLRQEQRFLGMRGIMIQQMIATKQAPPPSQEMIEALKSRDPKYIGFQQMLMQFQQQYQVQSEIIIPRLQATHSKLNALRRQLQGVEEAMKEREQQIRLEASIVDPQNLEAQLIPLKQQFDLLQMAAGDIEKQMNEKTGKFKEFAKSSVEYDVKRGELEQSQLMLDQLSQEKSTLDIELKAQPRITEIDRAIIPDNFGLYFKWSVLAVVCLIGLSVGFIGVPYLEFHSRRLSDQGEVAEGLHLPVSGTLPLLTGNLGRGRRGSAVQASLIDSIDSIRASLMYAHNGGAPKLILVTSSSPGEGKTTVASQLAASLTRAGRRVALVDADVRSPSAHALFELALEPGFSELLRAEAEVDDVVQPTAQVPGLWVVASGNANAESVQALARDGAREVFDALRAKFDYVIIDAPAVLTAADSLLIGQYCDGAILTTLRDVSRLPQIYEASERLKSVGVELLGTVVNGVNNSSQMRSYRRQLNVHV